METLDLALIALVALALAGLLLAERRGSAAGTWIAKPLASLGFVALALPPGDAWLLAAIALSFVGDLLLIPKDPRVFRAGILVFLLAHVAFIAAFLARGVAWGWVALALVPLIVAAALVARWILPKAPAPLKPAVVAYMVVITAMVAAAAGATARGASTLFLAAALAFWTNDILVARDRFVTKSWWNRALGLPLYYGAMVVFAALAR